MAATTRGNTLVSALFIFVIIVAVNLLGMRFFQRWDLTENREYTVSQATKRVIDRLDDLVNVKVYFSKDLPPYLATLDRQVKDLLDEYRARSSNLMVEFLDPAADPVSEQAVQAMGIPKVQLNIIQRDKAEVTGAYLGIAVQYRDKTEVLPVVQTLNNLEYDLTAAIVKVSSEPKTVGVAGSGEMSLNQGLQGLQEILGRQYELRPVSLSSGPVPDDVSTLIVIDHDDLSEEALYRVDQFVMGGGRLLALAPGVQIAQGTLNARDRQVKLGPVLRTWGVGVRNALVADGQAAMATFSQGYMQFTVPYPWWPRVGAEGLSADHPVTATLDALVLPWASPLELVPADSAGGAAIEVTELVRSSERSFSATMPYDLNPQGRVRPPQDGTEPQLLGVALTGRFPSHWRGQGVPGDTLGTAPAPLELSPETQVVVIGCPRVAEDMFLGQFPSNAVFLANVVDWMTLGNDLIAIRSRGAAMRPLREVEDGKRNLLKTAAILGVPVLVVIGGLARLRWRKVRRRLDAASYGGEV